ncbi:MAG: beta/gamma crystallin-related protein [Candidatus Sulfotelmatobacter sp.]
MQIQPSIIVFKDSGFNIDNNNQLISFPQGWGYSYVGDNWNDTISSVIVLSGTWKFFENAGFSGASTTVGPGYYQFVEDPQFNMQNDTISSILCVSVQPQGDNPVVDI